MDYRVPKTETSIHLAIDRDRPFRPRIFQELVYRALLLVSSILEVTGDGPVPGHRFTQDYDDIDGYRLSVGIWSDRVIPDGMTYSIVRDTLVGLRECMVTRGRAFQGVVHVSHGEAGVVAFGVMHRVRGDASLE